MRWKWLFHFYSKQFIKSKLYMGASLALIILVISRIMLHKFDQFHIQNFGNLPSEISGVVQIVSIFYMIYAYQIVSNELQYGIQTFFTDGHRIMVEKISAMGAVHSLFQLALAIITYGFYSFYFLINGLGMTFLYAELFRFIMTFLLEPMILYFFMAILVAIICGKRKISFFLIAVGWIVTGGMNTEFLESIFNNITARDWKILLSFSMEHLQYVYSSFIGYDISLAYELRFLFWLLLLGEFFFLLSLRWAQDFALRKRIRNLLIVLPIVLLIVGKMAILWMPNMWNNADYDQEVKYYQKLSHSKSQTNEAYDIQQYVMHLEGDQLQVTMSLKNMKTVRPTFQLYHAYVIQSITNHHRAVSYDRYGDLITLHLKKPVDQLQFTYTLRSTNFYPILRSRKLLPGNMAWYPKKNSDQMYRVGKDGIGVDFLPDDPTKAVKMTVQTKDKLLFINLPKKSDGVYEGKAQAVTLIMGQGKTLETGDYHITYPSDWPDLTESAPTFLAFQEKLLAYAQEIGPTVVSRVPSKIVLAQNITNGVAKLISEDHFVYDTHSWLALAAEGTLEGIPTEMMPIIIAPKKSPFYTAWCLAATSWMNRKLHVLDQIHFDSDLPFYSDSDDAPVKEGTKVLEEFQGKSLKEQQEFLKYWYAHMEEATTWKKIHSWLKGNRK